MAKKEIRTLAPLVNKRQIEALLNEVDEGRKVLEISPSLPTHGLKDLERIVTSFHRGIFIINSEKKI